MNFFNNHFVRLNLRMIEDFFGMSPEEEKIIPSWLSEDGKTVDMAWYGPRDAKLLGEGQWFSLRDAAGLGPVEGYDEG